MKIYLFVLRNQPSGDCQHLASRKMPHLIQTFLFEDASDTSPSMIESTLQNQPAGDCETIIGTG